MPKMMIRFVLDGRSVSIHAGIKASASSRKGDVHLHLRAHTTGHDELRLVTKSRERKKLSFLSVVEVNVGKLQLDKDTVWRSFERVRRRK